MVLLCAYAINNVHLMLLSGLGAALRSGRADRRDRQELLLPERRRARRCSSRANISTPFISAGGSNWTIDDFNINWNFDRGPHGFVGGYNVAGGFNSALPIGYRPVPRGTPQWGKAWKAATAKWYQTAMNIGASAAA